MYHGRFSKSYYEAGFKYGQMLKHAGVIIDKCPTFPITEERLKFVKECEKVYDKYYPGLLEEIHGIADGNCDGKYFDILEAIILSMYCYNTSVHCSCFAFRNEDNIIFGRNSDFLVSIEKLTMNVMYKLDNVYSFYGNTTAFVEMEDGINEKGLAIGLTFIPIKNVKPGFNVGTLLRFLLEHAETVKEAIEYIRNLPIASGGTLTMADSYGDLAVVELACDEINIDYSWALEGDKALYITNEFVSKDLVKYNLKDFDNWNAKLRYNTIKDAFISIERESLPYSIEFAKDLLKGKYGFICQYNRKENADTLWSVVYDCKNKRIYKTEKNPSRTTYKEDLRFKFE